MESLNWISLVFDRPRVLLPVIHTPFGEDGARRAVDVARAAGCDGVFLINQGMSATRILKLAVELVAEAQGGDPLYLGVNLLGTYAAQVIACMPRGCALHVWSDDAGVDALGNAWLSARRDVHVATLGRSWSGLHFGGTAFKGGPGVDDDKLAMVARRAASYVEVVTTSGPATGVPPPLRKIERMRDALGTHALAVASGITPENVGPYLPLVDAFLVASGIESSFGVLDPARTKALADKVHG